MNVKRGLVRLGIALSVVYWGFAGVLAYEETKTEESAALGEVRAYLTQGPWQRYQSEFKVTVADGRMLTVRAADRKAAEVSAAAFAKQFPRYWLLRRKLAAAWSSLSRAAIPYLVLVTLVAAAVWVVRGFSKPKPDAA